MEPTRPRQPGGGSFLLLGRERECARIDELLEAALAGESGAMILVGEPGIGKTALLDYAAARGVEMQLLRTAGVEAEADLAFAGLYGLLRPILDRLGGLPELQANALSGALGRRRPARTASWPPRPRSDFSPRRPRRVRCCAWSTTRSGSTHRPPMRSSSQHGGCGPSGWQSCSPSGRRRAYLRETRPPSSSYRAALLAQRVSEAYAASLVANSTAR